MMRPDNPVIVQSDRTIMLHTVRWRCHHLSRTRSLLSEPFCMRACLRPCCAGAGTGMAGVGLGRKDVDRIWEFGCRHTGAVLERGLRCCIRGRLDGGEWRGIRYARCSARKCGPGCPIHGPPSDCTRL